MKIQCACGVKHHIEVTPRMAQGPVTFICPACGRDYSEYVAGLVRQELAQAEPSAAAPVPTAVLLDAAPVDEVQAPSPAPVVRVNAVPCGKHPGQVAVEKCRLCGKPICPKCMELFGYVCSPLCKAKADSHGIDIPVYGKQQSVVEARFRRKLVQVVVGCGSVVLLLVGLWVWYTFWGSQPKSVFSVRFPDMAYSGQVAMAGPKKDQIVFLHGGTLARYDLKTKNSVWSRPLIDRAKIEAQVDKDIKDYQAREMKLGDEGIVLNHRLPERDKLIERAERAAAAELALHVRGSRVWVADEDNLTLYDWETGKPGKQIAISTRFGDVISRGDELLLLDISTRKPMVTHIDLSSCESRLDELGTDTNLLVAATSGGKKKGKQELAGLPGAPGSDLNKPMDPAKVAQQAQDLPFPARIALPAVVAGNLSQERAFREMQDDNAAKSTGGDALTDSLSVVPTPNGFLQFSVKLVESRMVERSAMKAAPARSILDGKLTAGNSLEAAGEILNEMQRARGGDKVFDDFSRYQVVLKNPGTAGATETWVGEVVGRPSVFPLQTVTVVASSQAVMVFNKANRPLWQAQLSFDVPPGPGIVEAETTGYGLGPCVEHKGTLYVADEGMLTAFDLKNGKVRWRMPSVGIAGMFFDHHDMLYVNTTTASPEKLRYSRQIELGVKDNPVIQKLDPADGKILWSVQNGGLLNRVSGKFLFSVSQRMPRDEDEGPAFGIADLGLNSRPYLKIRRLSPSSGNTVWEHYQERAPLDLQIEGNEIRLVFRKEVQVLRFPSF